MVWHRLNDWPDLWKLITRDNSGTLYPFLCHFHSFSFAHANSSKKTNSIPIIQSGVAGELKIYRLLIGRTGMRTLQTTHNEAEVEEAEKEEEEKIWAKPNRKTNTYDRIEHCNSSAHTWACPGYQNSQRLLLLLLFTDKRGSSKVSD